MRLIKPTIWLICLLSVLSLIFLSLNGLRGIVWGDMSALAAYPNLLLLGVCLVTLLACWFIRPRKNSVPVLYGASVVLGYTAIFLAFCAIPSVNGYYTLRVKVVDSKGNALTRVTLDSLLQKSLGFPSLFLPEDVRISVPTDNQGVAYITANRFQRVGILANREFGHGSRVDPKYRYSAVSIEPRAHGTFQTVISWDKQWETDGSNMRNYPTEQFNPLSKELIIFLPREGESDLFDYSALE